MNILFTVCGRAGSKGLKNKNLKEFLGYPLVYYSLSAIDLFIKNNEKRYNIDICVNTDSKELFTLVDKTNLDVTKVERDLNLSKDDTPKIDVIKNSLNVCEIKNMITYDVVVDVDITSPLRTVNDLQNVIEKKIENKSSDIVFSVVESRRNPYFNMVKDCNGIISRVIDSNYVARQQAPEVLDMNASIYAYDREFLYNENVTSIFDGKVDIVKMIDTAVLDIDSENDFEFMEVIAKYLLQKNISIREVQKNIENILNNYENNIN